MPLEGKLFRNENKNTRSKQIAKSIDEIAREKINHIILTKENQLWFPTLETHSSSQPLGVEKLIYDELMKFKQFEAIRPSENQKDRETFLNLFAWRNRVLTEADKKRTESLLVEFNEIFTRHRLDIGYTHKYSMKLTPDTDRPSYSKTQVTSIHLKDELLSDLALLQYYGVIAILPFKTNGKAKPSSFPPATFL